MNLFRLRTGFAPLLFVLTVLASCGKSDSGSPSPEPSSVSITERTRYTGGQVAVSPGRLLLEAGEQVIAQATAYDEYGAPQTSASFVWTSSDPATVGVTNGNLTATTPGTASVIVKTAAGTQAPALLTVQVVAKGTATGRGTPYSVVFDKPFYPVLKGGTLGFACKVYDSRGDIVSKSVTIKLVRISDGVIVNPAITSGTQLSENGAFRLVAFDGTQELYGDASVLVYDGTQQGVTDEVVAVGIHRYAAVLYAYDETSEPALATVYHQRYTAGSAAVTPYLTIETPERIQVGHTGVVTVGNDARISSEAAGSTTLVFEYAGKKSQKTDVIVPLDLTGRWKLTGSDGASGAVIVNTWNAVADGEAYLLPRTGITYADERGPWIFGGSPAVPDRTAAFMAALSTPNSSCLVTADGQSFTAGGVLVHGGVGLYVRSNGPIKDYSVQGMSIYLADGKAYSVFANSESSLKLTRSGSSFEMRRDNTAACSGQPPAGKKDSILFSFLGTNYSLAVSAASCPTCNGDISYWGAQGSGSAYTSITLDSLPAAGTVVRARKNLHQNVSLSLPGVSYQEKNVTYTKTNAGYDFSANMYKDNTSFQNPFLLTGKVVLQP